MSEPKEIKMADQLLEIFGTPTQDELGIVAAYNWVTQPQPYEEDEEK